MGFSSASGQNRSSRRGRARHGKPMAEINVTPMVDVMLVLLIVFMVAAPLLTVGVPIDLPQTKAQSINAETKPVSVSVSPDGLIYLNDTEVLLPDLIARMNELSPVDAEQRVFVRGDASANYGAVMRVMGELSAAGYSKIGLITDQEQGR